ncbi:uncharacterized protein [Nicotiana sylvestris]|uniref:uncharacterized protein n=1 Tax=Nicotiana sylvestris TaxID=4096 RepID=UPI00388CD159
MITKIESKLSKVRAKIIEARTKATLSGAKADQEMAIYLKDATDAQAELKRFLDREERIKEYARCRFRRKVLEEIHVRGFVLPEELARARVDERDTQSLLFDSEESKDKAGLGENMQMRPPLDGESEALELDMNKKRKSKAAVARPDRTVALTFGSNPIIEGEDNDGSPLRRRTRSSARDLQAPRSEAAESGMASFGRAGEQRVLEEDADLASNRMAGFGVASARRTVGIDTEGLGLGSFQEPGEIVTLAAAKSESEQDAATYKEDAITTHTIVCDISMEAEQRLIRAVEYTKAKAKRETLEKLEARGFELSADLEEARAVEGRLALLIALDRGEYDSGAESPFKVRSNPPKEEERFMALGSRNIGKRKDAPGYEKACSEAPSSQRLRGSDSANRQPLGVGASSNVASAFGEAQRFGLMAFNRLKAELLHCEAPLRDARDREKSLRLLCAAKENKLVSLRRELKDKVDKLEQLWGKVGKAKREFIEPQAHVNAHSAAKERAQARASILDAQIQAARANDSARAKIIVRLSSKLSRAKTEEVKVRAEIVMDNTRAGQKMVAYSRSAAAAKAELKKTLDRLATVALTLFGRRDLLICGSEACIAGDNGSYAVFAYRLFVGFVFCSLSHEVEDGKGVGRLYLGGDGASRVLAPLLIGRLFILKTSDFLVATLMALACAFMKESANIANESLELGAKL